MGIGLLSVLQLVPWSDVIKNAPKVADGAKQLWKSVGKKPAIEEAAPLGRPVTLSPEAQAIATLKTHQAAAEVAISQLHEQMLKSSELIATLAEQNTLLVKHVERNRVQLMWLTGATGLLAIVSVAGLCLVLLR